MKAFIFYSILIIWFLYSLGIWSFPKKKVKSKKEKELINRENLASLDSAKGYEQMKLGNYKEAIIYYNNAIKMHSTGLYYNNRGFCKSEINDFNGAIEDYSFAINFKPSEAVYWANRGIQYHKNNKRELALIDLNKAVELGSEEAKDVLEKHYKQKKPSSVFLQKILGPYQAKISILNELSIDYFYHVTHIDNLESILNNGLKSHNMAHDGLLKTEIADERVNKRRIRIEPIYERSIHEYVPLYFNPRNPMLYSRKNIQNKLIVLAIDRNIIFKEKFLFTDGNAASKSTKFFNSIEDLSKLNWTCINDEFWSEYDDGKRIRCAETLIFPLIEPKWIKKILTNDYSAMEFAKEKANQISHIIVEQDRSLFFNNYYKLYKGIDPIDELPF